MLTASLSPARHPLSLHKKSFLSLETPRLSHGSKLSYLTPPSSFLRLHPLKISINHKGLMLKKNPRGFGTVCYAAPWTPHSLQWICTVSSVALMLAKGTAVHKSFLVPLFALQAPTSLISWIKGEYGIWAAFLALLTRLFFFIPGELELPLIALLLVIVAPYQVMNLRGTQGGAIVSLAIAAYLVFQHFSWAGSLRKAFDQGSIVATLAIFCIVVVSCLFLI